MSVLVSFPGRAGDLLWALPTVRAISEAAEESVDLVIAGEFRSMIPMLELGAPYLRTIRALEDWHLGPPNEWDAPVQRRTHDCFYQLGYGCWPDQPLPYFIYQQQVARNTPMAPLDLERPWLTFQQSEAVCEVAVGWTETWFELKVGLMELLHHRDWLISMGILANPGSRWVTEYSCDACDWLEAARCVSESDLFLGDCSALHVLACAIGKRCVIVEPMTARLNEIFWPFGMNGRVQCVMGTDGKPTFDARHTADTLTAVLKEVRG